MHEARIAPKGPPTLKARAAVAVARAAAVLPARAHEGPVAEVHCEAEAIEHPCQHHRHLSVPTPTDTFRNTVFERPKPFYIDGQSMQLVFHEGSLPNHGV